VLVPCGIIEVGEFFDGVAPSLPAAQQFLIEELQFWCFAGARKLQELFFGRGEGQV